MAWRRSLVAVVLLAGCSGSSAPAPSPVSPTPIEPQPTNIAGQWGGDLWVDFQGTTGRLATRAALQQTARDVTGTWEVTSPGNDVIGTINGTLEGAGAATTFRGTVTWDGTSGTPLVRCVGMAIFSGPAVPPELQWTSPQAWDFGGMCQNALRNATWTLARR